MKKLSLIALVAVMLVGLNSCQYKNPVLEESTNPMVKEFEMCNLLLGKSKTDAEKALKENGYTFAQTEDGLYLYTKKVDAKIEQEVVYRLGSKNKVCLVAIDFEAEASGTYLGEFAKMKEVVTTFGQSVTISTKEACDFNLFANSTGQIAKLDYQTMLSRIDSSTSGFACVWAADATILNADEVIDKIEKGELTGIYFDCESSDYMSYEVDMIVASQKYK